jgi:hypothetical protein
LEWHQTKSPFKITLEGSEAHHTVLPTKKPSFIQQKSRGIVFRSIGQKKKGNALSQDLTAMSEKQISLSFMAKQSKHSIFYSMLLLAFRNG